MDNITILGAGVELARLTQIKSHKIGIKVKDARNVHIDGFTLIGDGVALHQCGMI